MKLILFPILEQVFVIGLFCGYTRNSVAKKLSVGKLCITTKMIWC